MRVNEAIKKLRSWYRENPILGGAVVLIFAACILKGSRPLAQYLFDGLAADYATQILAILFTYGLVWLFGYSWCYRHGSPWKTFIAALPQFLLSGFLVVSLVMSLASDSDYTWKPFVGVLLGFLTLFRIGFLEESIYRGIIANGVGIRYGKDAKGVWLGATVSAATFGLMHLLNVTSGVSFLSACAQSVLAFFFGFFIVAAYYRGGSIWTLVLMHALIDSVGLFDSLFLVSTTSQVDSINTITFSSGVMYSVYLVLAIWLLRPSRIPEVIESLKMAAEKDGTSNS